MGVAASKRLLKGVRGGSGWQLGGRVCGESKHWGALTKASQNL
jgi:hypothetical protein